jgi:hypothetical protein
MTRQCLWCCLWRRSPSRSVSRPPASRPSRTRCALRSSPRTRPRSEPSAPRRSRRPASCCRSERTASSPPRCFPAASRARPAPRARAAPPPRRAAGPAGNLGPHGLKGATGQDDPKGATGAHGPVGPPGGFGLLNLGRANVVTRSLSVDGAFSSVISGSDGLPAAGRRLRLEQQRPQGRALHRCHVLLGHEHGARLGRQCRPLPVDNRWRGRA